jgi:hypothetical protein
MPFKRGDGGEIERFRAVKKYQVRGAEEALGKADGPNRAYRHARDIVPPNAKYHSEPEVSFKGLQVAPAVVVNENLTVGIDGACRGSAWWLS